MAGASRRRGLTGGPAAQVWEALGNEGTLAYAPWPEFDEKLCEVTTVTMAVQVNGKVKAQIELPKAADEDLAREIALGQPKVSDFLKGKEIKKFIYVPGRIVNVVVGK